MPEEPLDDVDVVPLDVPLELAPDPLPEPVVPELVLDALPELLVPDDVPDDVPPEDVPLPEPEAPEDEVAEDPPSPTEPSALPKADESPPLEHATGTAAAHIAMNDAGTLQATFMRETSENVSPRATCMPAEPRRRRRALRPRSRRSSPAPKRTAARWTGSRIDRDVADLVEKRNMLVHVVEEDLMVRGIESKELIPGVRPLSRAALPAMCAEHQVVSLW